MSCGHFQRQPTQLIPHCRQDSQPGDPGPSLAAPGLKTPTHTLTFNLLRSELDLKGDPQILSAEFRGWGQASSWSLHSMASRGLNPSVAPTCPHFRIPAFTTQDLLPSTLTPTPYLLTPPPLSYLTALGLCIPRPDTS